jgi:hypothetical protein
MVLHEVNRFAYALGAGGVLLHSAGGLIGRATMLPSQFGHTPTSTVSTHAAQNVHSKLQMRASFESAGRSTSQCSQLGLSASTELQFTRRRETRPNRTLRFRPARSTPRD